MKKPIFKKPGARAIPATKFVLFDGDGHQVQSDQDLTAWSVSECDYYGPAFTAPRDDVERALKAAGKAGSVEIDHGKFHVTDGKAALTMSVTGIPADDFPEPPGIEEDRTPLMLPGLADAVAKVKYCAAPGDVRPYLHGVFLEIRDGIPAVAATDGHRLHCVILDEICRDGELDRKHIIPPAVIPHIADDLLYVPPADKTKDVLIQCGNILFRPMEENYLDYWRVIVERPYYVDVDRADLLAFMELWLKAAPSGGTDNKGNNLGPCFRVENGRLRAYDSSSDDAEGLGLDLPADGTGEYIEIGIAAKYLVEALKATRHHGETVRIGYEGSSTTVHVDDEAVIMPIRI